MRTRRSVLNQCCVGLAALATAASCSADDAGEPGPTAADGVVFRNAVVLTMDERRPRAEAVLVRGDRIVSVGATDEVLDRAGSRATVIDLAGQTIVPGFIDAHSHRLGDFAKVGYQSLADVVPDTLAQGWTGVHELYVDAGRLDALRDLDQAGRLPLRVDAYLPVNTFEVAPLDDWYSAYRPGQMLSPHVRVAGLKFFVDYDTGREIRWSQPDLTQAVVAAHRQGWQVAAKAIGSATLEMLLNAFDEAQNGRLDPKARHRIEHILSVTPTQAARMRDLGVVAIFQTNIPGQLVGDRDIEALVQREPAGAVAPWRMLAETGVPMAGGTGWPSYYVAEPTGPPFASPVRLLYQAVTRAGNLGAQPEPWMRGQAITVERALRAYTMGSAFAAFADKDRGSITEGKLADLVVLSQNPVTVAVDKILDTRVLVTMIGGRAAWCAPDATRYCPAAAQASPPQIGAGTVTLRPGQPLRLALLAPESGQHAALGRVVGNAAQLAIADVGPVAGFAVQATLVDDGCEQSTGQAAAAEVASGGFVAVLGPACSASARSGLPALEQAGLATLSCAATAPDLPALAPNVFNRTVLDSADTTHVADVEGLAAVQALQARYGQRYGGSPAPAYRPFVGYCYDAAVILLQAIARTVSVGRDGVLTLDRAALVRNLRATSGHSGVTGTISFDQRGNRVP